MTKNHIGALPASTLIFCCRIFYLLTYSPRGPEYGGSASMTAFLAAGLVSIGLCAVFWGLLRRCGASGLPELFHRQGRVFAAFCELAVLLVLTGSALSTVMNASGFLTSAVYPGAGAQITAAAAMLVCAYGAYSGIEAVSRMALPVAAVFVAGLAVAAAGIAREIQPAYFTFAGAEAVPQVLELFFQALYHNTEVLLFLLLTDKVRGAGTAVYARGVLGSMTFYQMSILLVTVTLGPFAYVRSYPIYSMLAAAELSVVTRLDIINLLVWILVAFVRGAAYLYCMVGCVRRLAPGLRRSQAAAGVGIGMTVLAWYLCGSLDRGLELWELWSGAAPFLLSAAIILLSVLAALAAGKKVKSCENG